MLSYPIAEAQTLLEENLEGASKNLEACEEDLDFLREQITVRLVTLFGFIFVLIIPGCFGSVGRGVYR